MIKVILTLCLTTIIFAQRNYDKTIKKYFFVELIPNKNVTTEVSDKLILKQHMEYIQQLAIEKKLMLAGPFKKGGGIFILNVKTKEEAESLIEKDETIKMKINSYRILEWYTEKGLFTLE